MNIRTDWAKISQLAGIVVAVLCGLGIGYHSGAQHDELSAPFAAAPPLNYYCNEPSFSEVENTKASLDGLYQSFRTEIQARRLADQRSRAVATELEPGSEPHIKDTIAHLERGMNEFAGTSQQVDVAQDLLLVLKKAKEFDRWVQVYLSALYKQPTHPVVARLASEAIQVAKLCGREREVLIGLGHVDEIPIEFEGKPQIQAALHAHNGALPPMTGERQRYLVPIDLCPNHARGQSSKISAASVMATLWRCSALCLVGFALAIRIGVRGGEEHAPNPHSRGFTHRRQKGLSPQGASAR